MIHKWRWGFGDAVKALPCPFCDEPPTIDVCNDPQCGCGFQFIACMNDECPVQPEIDRDVAPCVSEAVFLWNGSRSALERGGLEVPG